MLWPASCLACRAHPRYVQAAEPSEGSAVDRLIDANRARVIG